MSDLLQLADPASTVMGAFIAGWFGGIVLRLIGLAGRF